MSRPTTQQKRTRRRLRARAKVKGTATRPRISIFRSNRGIAAQLIDDSVGNTLIAASWTEPEIKATPVDERASKVGKLLAERAKEKGIAEAVFDRGGYQYHGQVKSVAQAARDAGLRF